MTKIDEYRLKLRSLAGWEEYLLAESGLPGPRGNLELAQAAAEEGSLSFFRRCLEHTADIAPVNTPSEFLAFCGLVGLGRLAAEGDASLLPEIRRHSADPRWRMREAAAMALQRIGDVSMERLLDEVTAWAEGSLLEQRAAAAAVCEPRLLAQPRHARSALALLDRITTLAAGVRAGDRRSPEFTALRKGLGYCWSVAAAALPDEGKPMIEKWLSHPDPDIRWIMRENLKKTRLLRVDAAWVERCRTGL